jgi:glycosyltransferase involved in cell wall biosynthesis
MRVLHLIPTLKFGGAERQARQLLLALAGRGVHVGLFSRLETGDAESLRAKGIAVSAIDSAGNYSPKLLLQLGTFVRSWQPDVIQTWLPMMDILGGIAGNTFRIPYIVSERCEGDFYPAGLKTSLRTFFGGRAAAIATNSAVGAAYWHAHPHVHIIPNGVDLKGVSGAAPRQTESIQRPVLVCMARLAAQKNQARLIEAMTTVRERFPAALLQLLGDGPDRPQLEDLTKRLGLENNVQFAGFREDAWSWLKAADLALLVSHFEGTPNAALEAAAGGCPIVVSDIPAHRAAFSADDVVFVDKDDPRAIAAGIVGLLDDRQRSAQLVANAAARVATLTIEASAARYLDLYSEVAG